MKPVVKVIQTAKNEKQAWRKLDDLELFKYYNFRMNTVSVDSSISYQKLLGFGGAFTEAAAYTWANADEKSKDEIVKAYFDKEHGLAYNLGRTTIHGCDFSLEPYTYIEEGDLQYVKGRQVADTFFDKGKRNSRTQSGNIGITMESTGFYERQQRY